MKMIPKWWKGNIIIEDNSEPQLEMKYTNSFLGSVAYKLGETRINIKPKHFVSQNYKILKDNSHKGDIFRKGRRKTSIRVVGKKFSEEEYVLSEKGFWNRYGELKNANDQELFRIKIRYSWKNVRNDFEVEKVDADLANNREKMLELLSYCTFVLNNKRRQR